MSELFDSIKQGLTEAIHYMKNPQVVLEALAR